MCLTIIFFIASLSQKFQHFRHKILALVRQKINLDRNIINVFAQFGRKIRVVENPHRVIFSGEDVFLFARHAIEIVHYISEILSREIVVVVEVHHLHLRLIGANILHEGLRLGNAGYAQHRVALRKQR